MNSNQPNIQEHLRLDYFNQKEMDLYKSLCSNCVLQSVLDGVEVKKKSVE